jgi:hypothetical protein
MPWLILYASDETNAHPVWGRMERETGFELLGAFGHSQPSAAPPSAWEHSVPRATQHTQHLFFVQILDGFNPLRGRGDLPNFAGFRRLSMVRDGATRTRAFSISV